MARPSFERINVMNNLPKHIQTIGANLTALRAILTTAIDDIDHGLEAVGQGSQDGAVGSIIPVEHLLKQATTLIQAILVLHRQN
jgi:hypothetical protein